MFLRTIKMYLFIVFLCIGNFYIKTIICQNVPSCNSEIFCKGKLLDIVQMSAIFNDSKTFVDLKLKYKDDIILENFNNFLNKTNNKPRKEDIKKFVFENFEEANEFDNWIPNDYNSKPKFLNNINNEEIKNFAKKLIGLWPILARKVKKNVTLSPDLYSLIPVDNGFIIPGGRFKEFYYWDSYWIIKGLLISEMYDTVKGILENFLSLIKRFGFIPNGSRIYYLNRSQPPLLTLMVCEYIKITNNKKWLKNNIHLLDKELKYWIKNHTVTFKLNNTYYTLARYYSDSGSPRPESYLEDVKTAEAFSNINDKKILYANIKSAAESGWDFSSRWIVDSNGSNMGNISDIKTHRIIPVDLNSFLCKAFKDLSYLYINIGDIKNGIYWLEKSLIWKKSIHQVLYNDNDGIWYDFDLELKQQRKIFYASNLTPLWTESYLNIFDGSYLGKLAVKYILKNNLIDYHGGIPTSLEHSGEQWDFPNAWAPLQAIIIFGLEQSGDEDAKKLAKEFAKRWLTANIIGFNNTGMMFEKYDSLVPGQFGGGGEYIVQSGFGWTNGIALQLIHYYYTKS